MLNSCQINLFVKLRKALLQLFLRRSLVGSGCLFFWLLFNFFFLKIDASLFFHWSFEKDQLTNTHWLFWLERLKIGKLTKFQGYIWKAGEDIGPQSREISRSFVWWGPFRKSASHKIHIPRSEEKKCRRRWRFRKRNMGGNISITVTNTTYIRFTIICSV